MWQESHMGRETRESKVTRLERHVGRRSCGSSDMRTCRKMAQWGPIAEDDGLAGRKCEKGASPSTDKVESLSHDTATTCAFVMMRPIANTRLLLSQRISGCNRAPLWHFLTPGRRNSAIRMHGNQRQSSQRTSDAQMRLIGQKVCLDRTHVLLMLIQPEREGILAMEFFPDSPVTPFRPPIALLRG